MAIPGFQKFLLPLLQFCSDGKNHTLSEAATYCFSELNISEDELKTKSAKGTNIAYNRVAWAKTYLSQAKMLASIQRGIFAITPRGKEMLAENHQELTIKDLKRFDEFLSFYGKKAESSPLEEDSSNGNSAAAEKTPEERIEEAMAELNNALASELMDRIKTAGPEFFEKIVVRLIAKMGYGDGQQTPYSHDGGIDGIINQDKLGLDAIYLQAKMWDGNVGKPLLQNFAGALEERKASKGIFITTGDFAASARQYIEKISKRIILINGLDLVRLMIRYNVGVAVREEKTYQIKNIDLDFFDPEG